MMQNNELKKYMFLFGYKEKEIEKILNFPSTLENQKLLENAIRNLNLFLNLGYTREQIIKLTVRFPHVLSCSEEDIINKINNIIKLGYTKKNILKMTTSIPQLYGLNIENMQIKINDMIELGYTKKQVIKMTIFFPAIFRFNIENIRNKINSMIKLGYTKEQVIKITALCPSIYGYSIESIKTKLNDIINLGYTKQETIKMTLLLPTLYSLNIENIKRKIDFYKEKNIDFWIKYDTERLMQSVELSYARYKFYENVGISIYKNNYKKLFIDQKEFIREYGKTNKQLMEEYNYDEYVKGKTK